ncbi:MAG: metal ABC transporter ATP-binding protein [Actinomycetota bacterium]|nr:metal ABC transporter ATP-binding protein [Actinomycetota bacterium]
MRRSCKVAEFFDGKTEGLNLIRLEHVDVKLGGRTVLENINFSLEPGMFLGVIGPNGAGKTTLLRVILGFVRPSSGNVSVMGMSPSELKSELHHIGYMPQQVLFDRNFPVSVLDVVLMGRVCCIGLFKFPSREDRSAALESIKLVGLEGLENRQIGELSAGQQKRAFLARALCKETKILLLDEPTSGLDMPVQQQFMELLDRLKGNLNLSIVFVSHDVNVLARYADELACINRTMHIHGKPKEVLSSERLKEAYRCEFDFLVGQGRGGKTEANH